MTQEAQGSLGVVWGAKAIAVEVGAPVRKVFRMLEEGTIPAKKVGGTWCTTRRALEEHFAIPPRRNVPILPTYWGNLGG